MDSLKSALMKRDGITADEADTQINDARDEMFNQLSQGEMPFDLMMDEFGLEPDYLEDLIF